MIAAKQNSGKNHHYLIIYKDRNCLLPELQQLEVDHLATESSCHRNNLLLEIRNQDNSTILLTCKCFLCE